MKSERLIEAIVIVAILASIGYVVYLAMQDSEQWEEFKSAHQCKIVGEIAGDVAVGTGVGLAPNGQIVVATTTTSTPGKTGWKCDDGVTYWK